MRWCSVAVLALLGASGCGAPVHAPPPLESARPLPSEPPTSAGRSAAEATTAPSGACNAVESRALPILAEADPTPYPNFEGGTIAPGTYVATHIALHVGEDGPAPGALFPGLDETLVIDATTVQAVNVDGDTPMRWSARWSTSGTTLRWTRTCPDRDMLELGYTATPTELRIGLQSLGTDLEVVYRRIDD